VVAKKEYALQGWQRNKIYPDFIACVKDDRVLVLETKGLQLKGNDDTEYKQKLFDLLTNEQIKPLHAGVLELAPETGAKLSFHMLMEDAWREELLKVLG